MGLSRAGFDVVGVDNRPQPRYPFTFVQGDALCPPVRLEDFDFIWASPPCQAYSQGAALWRKRKARVYPDLVAPTRGLLAASGVPWVIENVVNAPVRPDLVLSGRMFGLRVERRRLFEISGFFALQPVPQRHPRGALYRREIVGVYRGRSMNNSTGEKVRSTTAQMADAMGIDWMPYHPLTQAIPPAYSEFIGRAALQYLRAAA
jgi:DNA (cytosine-5)-methyltransferase 1